jgi:pimeloyl-ACP methyl ester carboxylesterase
MDKVYPYDHTPNHEGAGGFSENLLADEYSLVDEAHNLAGFLDSFAILYPQIQDIDLRKDATRLDIPIYLVEGRYEVRGRAELAQQWFAKLQAPHKQIEVFDTSGHRPQFEQPETFTKFMTDTVLANTDANR